MCIVISNDNKQQTASFGGISTKSWVLHKDPPFQNQDKQMSTISCNKYII